MKIHAPSEIVFWVAAGLVLLALLGHFIPGFGFLTQYQFWIAIAASAVLLVGSVA